MNLFHAGYQAIPNPDIHYGRKNADFGQGFYLSDDEFFCHRWAKERRGQQVYLNKYTLDLSGLAVKRFSRDREWFDYIQTNRAGREDTLSQYDVIIGPIANDTIFDTNGILTSGLLDPDISLQALQLGPTYTQAVIKTKRGAEALQFCSCEILPNEHLKSFETDERIEEAAYQEQLGQLLTNLLE